MTKRWLYGRIFDKVQSIHNNCRPSSLLSGTGNVSVDGPSILQNSLLLHSRRSVCRCLYHYRNHNNFWWCTNHGLDRPEGQFVSKKSERPWSRDEKKAIRATARAKEHKGGCFLLTLSPEREPYKENSVLMVNAPQSPLSSVCCIRMIRWRSCLARETGATCHLREWKAGSAWNIVYKKLETEETFLLMRSCRMSRNVSFMCCNKSITQQEGGKYS